jgi:hypothetical protein
MKKIVFMDEKQNKLKNNTIKENISHRDQQILINKLYLKINIIVIKLKIRKIKFTAKIFL